MEDGRWTMDDGRWKTEDDGTLTLTVDVRQLTVAAAMSIATNWGTSIEERSLSYPCDSDLKRADAAYHRGVSIDAPAATVFRWLCQMRAAPYSYDWIDNFGRRSPRTLTPGLEQLVPGETTMMGRWRFDLLEFEQDRQITMRHMAGMFGQTRISYMVVPQMAQTCRLLAKVVMRYPRSPIGWLERLVLPWVDLFMMRKQLLNFKALAEQSAGNESK